jgi:NhaP-type Na+/H+ or K+/H+ antiporter
MFKRIITHPGFWRSVMSLAVAFILLFILIKWIIEGFKMSFFAEQGALFFIGLIGAGLVYGFFSTYGKFWKKFKEDK